MVVPLLISILPPALPLPVVVAAAAVDRDRNALPIRGAISMHDGKYATTTGEDVDESGHDACWVRHRTNQG